MKRGDNMKHDLKILPEFFYDIASGKKTFEVRKNDRNYQVGDILVLHKFYPETNFYDTNTYVKCIVTYMVDLSKIGIPGYVAMQILVIDVKDYRDEMNNIEIDLKKGD